MALKVPQEHSRAAPGTSPQNLKSPERATERIPIPVSAALSGLYFIFVPYPGLCSAAPLGLYHIFVPLPFLAEKTLNSPERAKALKEPLDLSPG